MPTRLIREGILSSEKVNALTERAELFYRRLMSVADDYGRFSANLTLLRASCYPLKLDSVKEDSIKKHLAEAVDAGLIVLYTVAGKDYGYIVDFGQRIQSKSKFPEPPEESLESTVIHRESPKQTALVGGVVEDEVVGVDARKRATPPRTRKPTKTTIPHGFDVSERVREWARKNKHTRLDEHMEAFRIKAAKQGYTYVDWDAAFMEAVRENWANLQPERSASPSDISKGPAESPLQRAIEFAKHQFDLGGMTAPERDAYIASARMRHGESP